MIFRGRYDKQMEQIKEKNKGSQRMCDVEDVRSVMEKGDIPALIISGLLVILPIVALALLFVSFVGFKFIAR